MVGEGGELAGVSSSSFPLPSYLKGRALEKDPGRISVKVCQYPFLRIIKDLFKEQERLEL